ncbi:hypothetical protein NDU88_001027 [Pleurodeles waltl]|uniref:Uncharacterized protein n=1 Tax=Pleurodeles waltl TaxID=8319 RepID=A0AAV7U996_PLEWA|nr:hypothetical protein NDU88_001027 [Pleurodeles waltl]
MFRPRARARPCAPAPWLAGDGGQGGPPRHRCAPAMEGFRVGGSFNARRTPGARSPAVSRAAQRASWGAIWVGAELT